MFPMEHIKSTWWLLALAGAVTILFGIAAIFWPGPTLGFLILLFGFYAVIYGLVELAHMFGPSDPMTPWWMHMLVGLVSLRAGLLVLFWPRETTITLLYLIAVWAITIGIIELVAAFAMNRLDLALGGVISVLFGLLLLANPTGGAVVLITVIGVFAIIRGILMLAEGIRDRSTPAVGS